MDLTDFTRPLVVHMNQAIDRVSGQVSEPLPTNWLNFASIYGRVRICGEKINWQVIADHGEDSSSSFVWMVTVNPELQAMTIPTGLSTWNGVANSRYCCIKPQNLQSIASNKPMYRKAYASVRKMFGLTKGQFMADNDYAIPTTGSIGPPNDHAVEWALYTAATSYTVGVHTYSVNVVLNSTLYCIFDQQKQTTST